MNTVAYRWTFCPGVWGEGPYNETTTGVLKTGIKFLYTNKWAYNRESLKHGYYRIMTLCSDTPFGLFGD